MDNIKQQVHKTPVIVIIKVYTTETNEEDFPEPVYMKIFYKNIIWDGIKCS